jgi:hypothetical protein
MIPKFVHRWLFRLRPAEKWTSVPSYNDLHGLLWNYGVPASPAEFASGPLRRFFDLALAPGLSDGQRCRIVEHARSWASRARAQFREPAAAAELASAIGGETARLTAMGAPGRWVVDVFEGDHTHHAAPAFPDDG